MQMLVVQPGSKICILPIAWRKLTYKSIVMLVSKIVHIAPLIHVLLTEIWHHVSIYLNYITTVRLSVCL